MESIGTRTAVRLLLATLLVGVGQAQDLSHPSTTTSSQNEASAREKKSPAERVVLKVGSVQVTQAEFEASIGDFETQGKEGAGVSEKKRRDLGDDYASVLVLSQQAVATHMDSSPEIRRQLEVARLQVLSDAEFASLLSQAEPTSDEISQYYAAHRSDYDMVQLRRLFIWKRGKGSKNTHGLSPQDARARADKILQTYAAGGDTQKLAEEFKGSQDGLLDAAPVIFPRGELSPRMEQVAFALKEGEWSEMQDTPDSILLMQLVKHSHRQLGEVSSLIEKQLHAQKMQAKLDDLKKNAGIWMDNEYFGNASAPASAAKMPTSARPTLQEPKNQQEKNNANERQK